MSIRRAIASFLGYGVSVKKYNALVAKYNDLEYSLERVKRNTRSKFESTIFKGGKAVISIERMSFKNSRPYEVVLSTGEFIENAEFASYEEAENKAKEFVKKNPGETFFVIGPVSKVKAAFDVLVEKTESKQSSEI